MSRMNIFNKIIRVRIKFMDIDNWTKIADTVEIRGRLADPINYDLSQKVKELKKRGYELVDNELETTGEKRKFTDDKKTFTIEFRHGQAVVDANHPGYGFSEDQLKKKITQTVHYEGASNKTPIDNVTSVVLKRRIIVDKVTKKILNDSGWGDQQYFKLVSTPVLPGFKVSQLVVGGGKIDPDHPDQKYVVKYLINRDGATQEQTAKIEYVDILNNNRVILSDQVSGQANGWIEYDPKNRIDQLQKRGYELVDNGFNAEGNVQFFGDNSEEPVFIITMKHIFVKVNINHPDHAVLPKNYVKAINFKVIFQGAGKLTPQEITQTAVLTRTLTVIPQTGEVLATTNWQSNLDSFHDVKVPEIKGFVADQKVIKAPSIGEKDYIVTVNYVDRALAKIKAAERKLQEQKRVETAIVTFIDVGENGAQITTSGALTGQPGDSINDFYSTQETINSLKKLGYEVVFNNFDIPGVVQHFDNNDLEPQVFTVGLKKKATNERGLTVIKDESDFAVIK